MHTKKFTRSVGAALALALAPAAMAQALVTWSATEGDFYLGGNWDTGTVPGLTDIAIINNGGKATIGTGAGTRDLGGIRLGETEGSSDSGHIIMNGGTIFFDGPDLFPGSSGDDGLNGLDWEVGEKGLGRFEMHNDAVFRAGDDIKVGANAAGRGSVLIDGNARVSVGSGISVSEGGPNEVEQLMVIGGNAVVDSGNSMGAGNPLGSTDEGYLTMASGADSTGRLIVQDNAVLNFRRLSARQGNSYITVKNNGQMHIFDVLNGTGGSPENRPAETGPNSTFVSQSPGYGELVLQDNAVFTVNSDPASGPTKGLAISGPRDAGNAGGTAIMTVKDRAMFSVIQDLAIGTGASEDSQGTLEVVGANAKVYVGGNLSLAVDLDAQPTPGRGTLLATLTGEMHSTVVVTNQARIANGHLKVKLNGYTPKGGENYTLITAASLDGQFLSTDFTEAVLPAGLSWDVEYTATSVILKTSGSVAGPKTITVTTASSDVVAGQTNLFQAMSLLEDGDTITFNIPGAGPHYLQTPAGGYPYITANNVTIDGYSQPGAVPNSNPILAANNAQIKVVLDSRNGNAKVMDFPPDGPNDETGYGDTEAAVIGILQATNVTVRGLGILALPLIGPDQETAVYGVSFAKGANGRVSGCWIGLDVNGTVTPFTSPADGVTGFRYRVRDENDSVLQDILVSGVTLGVGKNSTTPRADFNIITGIPAIPVILEGENHRFSGNFFGVLPSGNADFNVALIPEYQGFFEGFIEIGRAGNNTVIGVDGDGVNDADERNVFGGTLSPALGGYDHSIEFYGQTPGTNIVVAGNYIGLGVDGTTRFTNNVPPFNAAGGAAQYRFGSDFDGVSDALEGNVVYNNSPAGVVADAVLSFFDELSQTGVISVRGNTMVNNYTPVVDPLRNNGEFITQYYSRVLADVNNGVLPVLDPTTTVSVLKGTVPLNNAEYPVVVLDLYIVDEEGIATGKALDASLYPEGWVQGKTYLGTYIVDGTGDLNPAAGAFEFNISALGLAAGTRLTAAASYSASPAGTRNAVAITSNFALPVAAQAGSGGGQATITGVTLNAAGTELTITWSGGTPPYQLQRRSSLNTGSWANEGAADATTSRTVPVTADPGFFQVISQ